MAKKELTDIDLRRYLPLDARMLVADEANRLSIKYVYEGLIVYQQDTQTYWKYTGTPPSNLLGDWEEGVGDKGDPGTSVLAGALDPDDVDGNTGDLYFQTADGVSYSAGDWFEKSGGTWGAPVFNSVGPQGPAGLDGSSIVFYGNIFNDDDTSNSQTLTTAGTYYKITQFTDESTDKEGVSTDFANDQIEINETGVYNVSYDCSIEGSASTSYNIQPRVNGSLIDSIPSEISFDTEITIVNASASGVLLLNAGDTLDLAVKADTSSATFTMSSGSLSVSSIGAQGVQGKAFVVTPGYSDVTLVDSLVSAVEGLSATTQDPVVLTVLFDIRSTSAKNSMGLPQNLKDHAIQWDGTDWFDNGIWRGPKGDKGDTGAVGPQGPQGQPAIGISAYYNKYSSSSGGTSAPSLPSYSIPALIGVTGIRGKTVVITGKASFFNDGNDTGIIGIYSNTSTAPIKRMALPGTGISEDVAGHVFWKGTISNTWSTIGLGLSKIGTGSSSNLRFRDALLEIKVED